MGEVAGYQYVAIDIEGRRKKGVVAASDEPAAFEQLRRDGLSPLSLKPRGPATEKAPRAAGLGDRESADLLSSLADLLKARADIRTALGILGDRFEKPLAKALCQSLNADIAGGESLERAFARGFQRRHTFVPAMVAAGEASGDLAAGLQRAADVIYSRIKLQDQMVSVLAYPSFVFVSSIGALLIILLVVIPSIAPLVQEAGGKPPMALGVMIATSDFLRANMLLLLAGLGGGVTLLGIAAAAGALAAPLERIYLDGPARRTVRGIVFGGFALSLGTMVAAGAPISDALRLAVRSVSSKGAQRRLASVVVAVRQGQALSDALSEVDGFPPAIVRLAAVGEASNAVGDLLMRGGKMEEDAALRRIEAFGRFAGPALIVFLGAIIGVMMGGLLTGLSQMGQSMLN